MRREKRRGERKMVSGSRRLCLFGWFLNVLVSD